ncbi:hypothetical protein COLO4_24300 [Corchorus olitorius]|uniref:Uncharacterized protein n=1 Tax=Corchorus olitorius TaxID=93759 RepID=A0A1R3IBF8_9ROSI|nr:hypothetical protein COLO4_24300 [Corchorus olitorius]
MTDLPKSSQPNDNLVPPPPTPPPPLTTPTTISSLQTTLNPGEIEMGNSSSQFPSDQNFPKNNSSSFSPSSLDETPPSSAPTKESSSSKISKEEQWHVVTRKPKKKVTDKSSNPKMTVSTSLSSSMASIGNQNTTGQLTKSPLIITSPPTSNLENQNTVTTSPSTNVPSSPQQKSAACLPHITSLPPNLLLV